MSTPYFMKNGVNALAENQTLKFCSGLTVVYGDNAAGKSGYIRIFKSAFEPAGPKTYLETYCQGQCLNPQ